MNHKIKRLWCASLRSGHWTQIKGQYHDEGQGRCAVGVLRDVLLPDDYLSWMMFNIPARKLHQIENMSDAGVSFCDIADWIEENL